MKKVGIVLVGIVILVGVIYCLPKEEREVLIEEKENTNTSLAFYLEQEDGNYLESTSLPSTGYTLNTEKSVCTNNTTPVWKENKLYLNNLKDKGTSCYLYFNIYEPNVAKEYILSHYNQVLAREDFSTTITDTTTGTIYKSLDSSQYDNDGEVYYFAGNPTDNWVKFGGFYWRIIRINGNGSIRMIYQGTEANTTGTGTQIGTSAFNSQANDNAYVGYMYGTPGSGTYESTHANTNDSTIKGVLDTWYQNNLLNYVDKIDGNTGFCGDRTPSTSDTTSNGQGGTGTTRTYYGAYIRIYGSGTPTLECSNSSDLFTISGSSVGNKALQNPIGLITADEVWYAGGYTSNNINYYLYTGLNYWTMSPFGYGAAGVFRVGLQGALYNDSGLNWTVPGVRPVINLKADVTLTGSGTSTDPYVVEGAA